ncbi:prolyl aminopeptidase [Motilimonas pumila]|uniref:Proline iminopeptidase n=1 Tax=Motilimonas pumila TaxID=2303987 RepID=A0A418YIZ6_9GAMM|nr:prolyl aminopeptidase [Motilimonas pumila]RJG50610.1 prolyl aminopeptidase [Motilimonas pumila]
MQTLYPAINSNQEYQLEVGQGHTLYVEESGSVDGIPVLFFHGGPGAGCHQSDRRFFDPERFRIILFDQRGCGRSTPYGELQDNSPSQLVEDIESIRQHLGVKQWLLFGGSWGATLALLYAQSFPEQVLGLVLRGTFLMRPEDLTWLYQAEGGAAQVFPDYFAEFVQPFGRDCQMQDTLHYYHQLLTSDNELERLNAAKSWYFWEGRIAQLHAPEHMNFDAHQGISMARISSHFFTQQPLLQHSILSQLEKVTHLPAILIHGRYDMVCKLENSSQLAKQWPNAQLQIVPSAGHSSREAGMIDALCKATTTMADIINDRTHSES